MMSVLYMGYSIRNNLSLVTVILSDHEDPFYTFLVQSNMLKTISTITVNEFITKNSISNYNTIILNDMLAIRYDNLLKSRLVSKITSNRNNQLVAKQSQDNGPIASSKYYFPVHLSLTEIKRLEKHGSIGKNREYIKARLRVSPHNSNEAEIEIINALMSPSEAEEIGKTVKDIPMRVRNRFDMNRALDGDLVLVQVCSYSYIYVTYYCYVI
jgi:hypothetical protein